MTFIHTVLQPENMKSNALIYEEKHYESFVVNIKTTRKTSSKKFLKI